MKESERLIAAIDSERWLHLSAIADSLEEEGRAEEAAAWRWIVRKLRWPHLRWYGSYEWVSGYNVFGRHRVAARLIRAMPANHFKTEAAALSALAAAYVAESKKRPLR